MKIDKYNEVKGEMKTGDLLQWKSNSIIGAAIRWKTNSFVNHSSLVLKLEDYEGIEKRRFTTEALEHGIILNYLSRRLEQFDGEVWWYPLKEDDHKYRDRIGEIALSLIGVPYDYKSIFRQVFGAVSTDARRLFCSEYCYLAYGFSGVAPTPGDMPKLGIFKDPIKL
jgi:hypothetical protein